MRSTPVDPYAPSGRGPRPASRRSGCGCLGSLLLGAALVLGPSLWLDRSGRVALARVVHKYEEVRISGDGSWVRSFRLTVQRVGDGVAAYLPNVSVDEARFDRLREGDTVRVRSLDCCPIFARVADRRTLDWIRDDGGAAVHGSRWVIWALAGIAFLVFAGRQGRPYLLGAALAWGVAGLLLARAEPRPAPNDGPARASAHVQSVRRVQYVVTGSRGSDFPLAQPYDVASLVFVPGRGADTVVSVDAVDPGTVPGLAEGGTVPVRYDRRRVARLLRPQPAARGRAAGRPVRVRHARRRPAHVADREPTRQAFALGAR
jgi:hypothetical protein